jgi:aspartate/methionine/tyrosine aminotransferase
MTGWRLGYLVAPARITDAAVQILQYVTTCGSTFSQHAAASALRHWAHTVDDMRDKFARRRQLLVDRLTVIDGLTLVEPSGGFYGFPSIRALGISSEAFCEHLLSTAHVATVPGSSFGDYGEGFFRIAYSTSYADVEEGLDRIADVAAQLRRNSNRGRLPAD